MYQLTVMIYEWINSATVNFLCKTRGNNAKKVRIVRKLPDDVRPASAETVPEKTEIRK